MQEKQLRHLPPRSPTTPLKLFAFSAGAAGVGHFAGAGGDARTTAGGTPALL